MVFLPEQHKHVGEGFSRIIAVIYYSIENWTEFDGWALSKGFDPLEIPTRRLVAAAWAFLTKDMDYEVKDNLINKLYSKDYEEAKKEERIERQSTEGKVITAPKDRWRAPKGWKPPGWDEEKAYQSGLNFMANKPG